MLVIGDKEIKSELSVRDRGVDKIRQLSKDKFIKEIKNKIENKE